LSESAPLRVAFTTIPRRLWAGGYNYQANLFAALNRYRPGEFTPVVFAGPRDDAAELAALAAIPGVEIVRSSAFDGGISGLAAALMLGLDGAANSEFGANHIDVVFENARFFGWRLPYPTVAWFPDFQHRRLPQLFSASARWRRDFGFRIQIASRRLIMLSSESALRDCARFYPGLTNPTSVVRFATQPAAESLAADPSAVLAQYGLPSTYFYLPNQFWRHKNHGVVVDALRILSKRPADIVVVASGGKDDPREPGYFDDIMRRIAEWNLAGNFRYLGMIPLPHVYALLRACTALINPSRFEGWSTTVEEAKSFGVPMILSDIDVHREQAGGSACYFGTDDPEALAGQLWRISQDSGSPVVRNLLLGLDARVAAFAADFALTVRRAIEFAGDKRGVRKSAP
jgi:glycosyltransferase involved in cell wall biosynthesis